MVHFMTYTFNKIKVYIENTVLCEPHWHFKSNSKATHEFKALFWLKYKAVALCYLDNAYIFIIFAYIHNIMLHDRHSFN